MKPVELKAIDEFKLETVELKHHDKENLPQVEEVTINHSQKIYVKFKSRWCFVKQVEHTSNAILTKTPIQDKAPTKPKKKLFTKKVKKQSSKVKKMWQDTLPTLLFWLSYLKCFLQSVDWPICSWDFRWGCCWWTCWTFCGCSRRDWWSTTKTNTPNWSSKTQGTL